MPLTPIDKDIWVASRPRQLMGMPFGCRMTVVRTSPGDLLLHSPIKLDSDLQGALDKLGTVRHIVAPNVLHHLFVKDYVDCYSQARSYAAPGLPQRRPDLTFHHVLNDSPIPSWQPFLKQKIFRGGWFQEAIFLHQPSKTLIVTDLVFHIQHASSWWARILLRLNGCYQRFGPSRIMRMMIRDKQAAREALQVILSWDFDRIVMSHGNVLHTNGQQALQHAFSWLLGAKKV